MSPLNTGNGVPSSTAPVSPAAAQQGMPSMTPPTPSSPIPPTPTSPNTTIEKALAMKKYIIAGVAVVALLVTAYMAYSYFTGISDAVTEVKDEAVNLNNKLSAPSDATTTDAADKAKLNDVVNELKDQYKTDNSATTPPTTPATTDTTTTSTDTNTSTPPGMNIEVNPTTDTTTTTDTGGVKR